jgi:hypothetical protein
MVGGFAVDMHVELIINDRKKLKTLEEVLDEL